MAPAKIAVALRRLLDAPRYRARAGRLGRRIAEEGAGDRAVTALEAVGRRAALAEA